MNIRILITIAVSVAVLALVGCQSDTQTDKDPSDISSEAGSMTEAAGKNVDQLAEQSTDLKDEYVAKADEKLGEIATMLSDWKGKVTDLPATTKPLAESSLSTLESAHDNATSALGKLKNADVAEWKEHVPAVDEAMSGVNSAMEKVKSFF